ncbi:MAG: alpha/beta hydrolase [Solobacterium sp.]|nr:alpha/beta hydrolase [Solobacterium sp.]
MELMVNGIQVHYEKEGQGRPLLLVHGNGEDHTIFKEAIAFLKDKYTCYALDSRGHGKSQRVKELHYEDMANDVVDFIKQLKLKDVVYYGFSDGGIAGLLAAMQCPEIKTLIVSGANLTPKGILFSTRFWMRGLYFVQKEEKMRLMLEEPNITKEMLSKIQARTLITVGSKDIIDPRETLLMKEAIPNADVMLLKGEDHESYIVHQERIGHIIDDFVKQNTTNEKK